VLWRSGNDNAFEPIQWTITDELKGATSVYITIFTTAGLKSRWRSVILFITFVYAVFCGELRRYIPFHSGLVLADWWLAFNTDSSHLIPTSSASPPRGKFQPLHNWWPIALSLLSLYLGSWPQADQHRVAYSRGLVQFANFLFPKHCILWMYI
jgi:hypothetical protein